jgi:hypothetical protein
VGKGAEKPRQVSIEEMSASEPLMTCRNSLKRCRNQERPLNLGRARRESDYRAGGNRHIGGMTSIQASSWNVGTCIVMLRESRRVALNATSANTDAGCRGGAARSSVEASVMDVERRGRVVRSAESTNLLGGMS